MTLPIQPIYAYKIPSSGTIAHSVEAYVSGRLEDLIMRLPEEPVLKVSTTPRGDYIEVMIFVGKAEIKTLLEENTDRIKQELRAMGILTVFYVKSFVGAP